MNPIYVTARRPLSLALMLFAGLMLAAAGARADQSGGLPALEERVAALEEGAADISGLEARIGGLEVEVAALTGLADQVAALQADVDDLAGVGDRLYQLETDVAALKFDLAAVVGDVSDLEARVASVESAIAGLVSRTEFDALEGRVSALELSGGGGSGGNGGPTELFVNCSMGDSINAALAAGDPSRLITVEISGICTEDVVIRRDDVTIQGAIGGSSKRIVGAVVVDGSKRIVISNLEIFQGSDNGILADKGSSVELSNLVIFNHLNAGISVRRNSSVSISGGSVNVTNLLSLEVKDTSDFSVEAGSAGFNGDVMVASNSNANLDGAAVFGNVEIDGHSRVGLNSTNISLGVSLSRDSLLDGGFKSGGTISGAVTCDNLQSLVFKGTTLFPAGISGCTEEPPMSP